MEKGKKVSTQLIFGQIFESIFLSETESFCFPKELRVSKNFLTHPRQTQTFHRVFFGKVILEQEQKQFV